MLQRRAALRPVAPTSTQQQTRVGRQVGQLRPTNHSSASIESCLDPPVVQLDVIRLTLVCGLWGAAAAGSVGLAFKPENVNLTT